MERFTKIDTEGKPLPADATAWAAVIDNKTNLMWTADDVDLADVQHAAAEKACADCNAAGFSDWRLPTVEELFALADRSRINPAIDTAYFPSCKSDWYWTSTAWAGSPASYAWIVRFAYGYSSDDDRYLARVRAVRVVSSAGQ